MEQIQELQEEGHMGKESDSVEVRTNAFEDPDYKESSRIAPSPKPEQETKLAGSSGKKKGLEADLEGSKMQSEL